MHGEVVGRAASYLTIRARNERVWWLRDLTYRYSDHFWAMALITDKDV